MTFELPRHNLPHLYKYMSADTARLVINTQKFRWSSPLLFNDPFDHQTGFVFTFTGEELARALCEAAESAVFEGPDFTPPYAANFGIALRMMRSIRGRLSRQDVTENLRAASLEIASDFPAHCAKLNEAFTAFLTHSRVLCLTETPANVVMWSHYASEHRGAVFKLRRLEELDHRFLVAQRVTYTDEPVRYMPLEDYVANLVGLSDHDPTPRVWEIAYRKHRDWSYEREWRVHVPQMDEPAGLGYSDWDEPKELFEAIYLGCRMEPSTVADIVALIRERLPETEIYKARRSLDRIRLEFMRIA